MDGLRIYLAATLRTLALTKDLGPSLSNDAISLYPLFIQYVFVKHRTCPRPCARYCGPKNQHVKCHCPHRAHGLAGLIENS